MAEAPETVGEIAELYLGNVLYAIERCAMQLDGEGKGTDAQFYRGIGRLLAEAHGRARSARDAVREPARDPARGID